MTSLETQRLLTQGLVLVEDDCTPLLSLDTKSLGTALGSGDMMRKVEGEPVKVSVQTGPLKLPGDCSPMHGWRRDSSIHSWVSLAKTK
jgi:hypothetical protein